MSRAASSFEIDPNYHSDDCLAAVLIPGYVKALLRTRAGRAVFRRFLATKGMYEYVIARTKYIDAVFREAVADDFGQIVLFGAGFDTRALRFQAESGRTQIFELDVPLTQQAKIGRYRQRNLAVPQNLKFVSIDFDRESIPEKLAQFGFHERERSLFIFREESSDVPPAGVSRRALSNLPDTLGCGKPSGFRLCACLGTARGEDAVRQGRSVTNRQKRQ